LGEVATEGVADPRERLAPFVEAILALRRQFRSERRFDDADRLRDLLTGCGVEVRDGRQGEESGWELA
jgi:cysteinyl-tRNA synthetase